MNDKNTDNFRNENRFFFRNLIHPRQPKTTEKLDVYDPENRELIMECREPNTGFFTKLSHFHGGTSDVYAPFNLVAKNPKSGELVSPPRSAGNGAIAIHPF